MENIKYDFTKTAEQNKYIDAEGAYTVVIASVKDHKTNSGDGCVKVTFSTKEKETINAFIMTEGKGAFRFKQLLDAIKLTTKELGELSPAKLVGKKLDITCITNPQDSRYLMVDKIEQVTKLTKDTTKVADEKPEEIVEEVADEEDFWN